jgi:NAD(P)-dependent dehydrogenase (short-subunit alcohol dehydrogenase family)
MGLDKTALVTGGGTGVGRAVALALAGEGCRVAVSGRREEKLLETAALRRGEPRILTSHADVADRSSVERLFAWAARELGPIDILVQCAGINVRRRALAELDPEDWERVLAVNASGAFYCMRAVLPQMRERRDGLIVNVSSVAGKRASVLGGVAYSASKFALTALGTCAGLEEGKNGIRISNIYPGEVNTPILDARPVPVSAEHRASILQPEDVAAAVVMLARLPARARIPEIVITPTTQSWA